MKHPNPTLPLFAALAAFACISARAEDGHLLIGKDLNDGGFEESTLQPWSPDPAGSFELATAKNLVKDGSHSCKVTLIGNSSGRSGSRLGMELKDIVLSGGRNFTIKFEAATTGTNPAPAIAGELVLFEGNEFVGSLPMTGIVTPHGDWEKFEAELSGEIPETWTGGRALLRITFFVDSGVDQQPYELVLDNVQLIQKP